MILIGMARNLRHTCATKTALADSKVALPIGLGWLTRTLATMRELSHGQNMGVCVRPCRSATDCDQEACMVFQKISFAYRS